jgi:transposase
MEGEKWMEIRGEKKKGLSWKEIGKKHNIDWRTAKRYGESEKKPRYERKEGKKSKLDPYKEKIDVWLEEAKYSAVRIEEKLKEVGYTGKYTIIREYVKKKKEEIDNKATVRFETVAGQQGQVDWAYFEEYRVYEEGIWKKLYCYLMILGYSRMRYIEFVTEMSTSTLIRCHMNAFRYYGGYPEEILYDNMKQVVVRRLLRQEDSTMNSQFEDFAGFYGFKPILCRPYRGQTKGKIERTVSYVRDNFMKGIEYDNLADLNRQAMNWCVKVNNKIHATTNEIPKIRLARENLNPLTREYMIDRTNVRAVGKDSLISYDGSKYSVPSEYAGKYVTVAALDNTLAAYYEGKQVALHLLSTEKNNMILNKSHYKKLLTRQSFDTENTLIHSTIPIDFEPFEIDLEAYDI